MWLAPDDIYKTALRKTGIRPDMNGYMFQHRKSKETKPNKYGFRSEFIRLGKSCRDDDEDAKYDEIDGKMKENVSCKGESKCKVKNCSHILPHFLAYKPFYCLLRHYSYLKTFSQTVSTQREFVKFVSKLYGLPEGHSIMAVFRPIDEIPQERLDLSNTDFKKTDLTCANFGSFKLDGCDLSDCFALTCDFGKNTKGLPTRGFQIDGDGNIKSPKWWG